VVGDPEVIDLLMEALSLEKHRAVTLAELHERGAGVRMLIKQLAGLATRKPK
jgi:hypothetical protein